MAQHHWLRSRAEAFESGCFRDDGTLDDKRLALFMRYRSSHERAFSKCLAELLKLRAEKRKLEIGFESQKRVKEEHTRKTRAARNGEGTPQMGNPASRSQGRSSASPHTE
jgi:hypothetical protein